MKRAVYTGSFDPITNGHMDIIRRASEIFDVLIVSVLNNKEKTPLFSVEERVKILEEATKDLPNVQIDSFSGLLVDYAREKDLHVIVRGLRAITDFEYELQMAQTNRMLSHGKIDTVFLTTSLEYAYLSSSAIKQIASFDGDITPCGGVHSSHAPTLFNTSRERLSPNLTKHISVPYFSHKTCFL